MFKRCIDNVTRARAFLPCFAVLKDFPFVKLLVSVVFQQQVLQEFLKEIVALLRLQEFPRKEAINRPFPNYLWPLFVT